MEDKKMIFRRRKGFRPVVCIAVVCFQLFVFSSSVYAQRFSGGSGTQADPYKISKPEDVIELSIWVETTLNKYYIMTNDIDMGSTKGFKPIGFQDSIKEGYCSTGHCHDPVGTDLHPFRGNFNGKGYAIKNLVLIDSSLSSTVSFFGLVKGATISNLTFDNAFFYGGSVAPFVYDTRWEEPLYMENCTIINSTIKGSSGASGFVYLYKRGTIKNCHVIHTTVEGNYYAYGFCSKIYSVQTTNSSVRYSTITSNSSSYSASGFTGALSGSSYPSGMTSGCCVSNCTISSGKYTSGFGDVSASKAQNCYSQATLITRTISPTTQDAGFGRFSSASIDSVLLLNLYAACEITTGTLNPANSVSFGINFDEIKIRITNCYYNTDPPTSGGSGITSAGLVGKTRAELKMASMVAHPGTQGNSLNYGQSSAAWKQDLNPPINKGFPILAWQQHLTFASTYYPTIVSLTSVVMHGFVFNDAAPIIERGFEWRRLKASDWTKVQVSNPTDNISFTLSSLAAGMYECKVYMKTASETIYGDTVIFGVGASMVTTLPAFNITETSAILYGSVEEGDDVITEQGFEWREAGTTAWTKNTVGLGSGNIIYMLMGLTKDVKYEFKAYIKTADTTKYGEILNFTAGEIVGIVGAYGIRPIEIYPNPTTGKITITGFPMSNMRLSDIKIFDIIGKLQESRISDIGKSEIVLDISHLSAGVYFLKVGGKVVKIIKE